MRERAPVQTVLDLPSPSSSSEGVDKPCDTDTPVKTSKGKGDKESLGLKKKGKKVIFSSPPKWRTKHTVGGSKIARGQRTALKTLQPNKSSVNSKLLVGRGSPRISTVGKLKMSKQSIQSAKSDSSTLHTENQYTAVTVGTQTDTDVTSSVDYKMVTEDEPPVEYWRSLAEQRREALAETLQENEELCTEVDELKSQITDLESKLKDLEYFAMMYRLASDETS